MCEMGDNDNGRDNRAIRGTDKSDPPRSADDLCCRAPTERSLTLFACILANSHSVVGAGFSRPKDMGMSSFGGRDDRAPT
jgi:hypothetical protein